MMVNKIKTKIIDVNMPNLGKVAFIVAFCASVPLLVFSLLFVIPMIQVIQNSGFELSQGWLSQNSGIVFLAVFVFMFVLSVFLLPFGFYLQWKQTKQFISQYLESAKILGINLQSSFETFYKAVPYGTKEVQISSPTGIGKINWKGKEMKIFHNIQLRTSPNIVIAGMSLNNKYSGAVTMFELPLNKGKSPGAGMFLLKSNLISGFLPSSRWKGQFEVELDFNLTAVIHGLEGNTDLNFLKAEVMKIFDKDLLNRFSNLKGNNSLLYFEGVFTLNHQGYANLEEIKEILDFLAKI